MPQVPASLNPLRTRKLEELPLRSPCDASPFDWSPFLADFLAGRAARRGAVVGPHGSGKTTFLAALKERLQAGGHQVVMLVTNRNGGRRIPGQWLGPLKAVGREDLVIVDGYDALGPLSRFWLRRVLRPHGGLIVTAHRRCAFPTLIEMRTSTSLLRALIDDLYATAPDCNPPSDKVLDDLYRCCHGNLREVFRRLYTMP